VAEQPRCWSSRIIHYANYNVALHVCVLSVSEVSLCSKIFLTFFALLRPRNGAFDCQSDFVERLRRKHEPAGDRDRRGLASRLNQLLNRNPLTFTEDRFGRRLSLESVGVPAVRPLLWCHPTILVDSFRPLASDQLRRGTRPARTSDSSTNEFSQGFGPERNRTWEMREVGFIHYRPGSLDHDLTVDRSTGRADFGHILRRELDNSIR